MNKSSSKFEYPVFMYISFYNKQHINFLENLLIFDWGKDNVSYILKI
jgi:hypothetical protein